MNICSFDRVQRGNYFGGELKLKIGKATGKDEITGEIIKGGGDMVVD